MRKLRPMSADPLPARPRRGTRRSRTSVAAVAALLTLAALTWSARDAHAHARLERSVPAAGAALATAPTTIELWFNELLDDEFNEILVFRAKPDGAPADASNLATGKPTVDDADRTHLSAPVAALASGAYVIQWKVLSRDGHSARGRVLFRVGAGE